MPYLEKIKMVYLSRSHVTRERKQGRIVRSLVDSGVQVSYIETILEERFGLQLVSFGSGFIDFVCWVVGRAVLER